MLTGARLHNCVTNRHLSFGLLVTETLSLNLQGLWLVTPIPEAVRSRPWVYDRSLAGIAGSNSLWVIDVCPL